MIDQDDPPVCEDCDKVIRNEDDVYEWWTCEHDFITYCNDCADARLQAEDQERILRSSYHW